MSISPDFDAFAARYDSGTPQVVSTKLVADLETPVSAYLKLADGRAGSDGLRDEIQAFVRQRLSAHEYPRQIRFIDEMPLTVSGKIRRVALRELDVAERQGNAEMAAAGPTKEN